jgi:hypothetical protein
MKPEESIARNADNETPMPWGNEDFTVEFAPELKGSEAAEVPEFIATRHELVQLAEYWQGVAIDRLWYFFITGQDDSSDLRLREFALWRNDRISKLIGEEVVNEAIQRVYARYQKDGRDMRLWDIFRNGDEEDWRAVTEERFRRQKKIDQQARRTLNRRVKKMMSRLNSC